MAIATVAVLILHMLDNVGSEPMFVGIMQDVTIVNIFTGVLGEGVLEENDNRFSC
jgi:hypothetical protein